MIDLESLEREWQALAQSKAAGALSGEGLYRFVTRVVNELPEILMLAKLGQRLLACAKCGGQLSVPDALIALCGECGDDDQDEREQPS